MDTTLLPALSVAGQIAAGLAAGIITTVGGMGGGLVLLLLLSMLVGPMAALAMTAPALLQATEAAVTQASADLAMNHPHVAAL